MIWPILSVYILKRAFVSKRCHFLLQDVSHYCHSIAKGIGRETLTYFSPEAAEKGSLVEVPLRGKKIFGIVAALQKAENKKSEINHCRTG